MKILVTGGAGFLGSNLCESLYKDGHEVICLDNFHTGRMKNLVGLDIQVIHHDIKNPLFEKEALIGKVDQIYNLACPASPPAYQDDPVNTTLTNVLGIYNVLKYAEKYSATVLQASTSEIYGEPQIHPQPEYYRGNVNPIGIRACYDEGKRCAESLLYDFHRKHGVDIRLVRIFNTYGPKMSPDDGRVITNFIKQALNNEDITIYGNGTQTRSFCFVDDNINALKAVMRSNLKIPFNVGNPVEITINELVTLILEKTKSKSRVIYMPLPQDDPTKRKPDITRIQESLFWYPKTSLSDGLDKTIEYLKGEL